MGEMREREGVLSEEGSELNEARGDFFADGQCLDFFADGQCLRGDARRRDPGIDS